MARLRTNVLHWGNKYDGPNTYKMGREGALDDALWDENELVDYVKATRGQKKKRPKKRPGCPGNDGNAHVYVWVTETREGWWSNKVYKVEVKRCCGCPKQVKVKYI